MADLTFGSERSAEDILSGRLRLQLAKQWYILPVLTVGQNADWLDELEEVFAPLFTTPDDDLAGIVQILQDADDRLLDFVYSYDKSGVLPPQETIARDVYPHEVLKAVMEVRLAANPTVGYGLAVATQEVRQAVARQQAAVDAAIAKRPSRPTSSSRQSTGGRTRKSATG
jgi:hypothetical protein